MYIGERFEKDGVTYEVTAVFGGGNYAYKKVETPKMDVPTFDDEVNVVKTRKRKKV